MEKNILILVLSLFLLSISTGLTAYSGGDGTESNPYQIATLTDLQELSNTQEDWVSGLYFSQTANIDASDTQNWNEGQGFSPIGDYLNDDSSRRFYGNYSGNGYTISNLYINRPSSDYQGLFGKTNEATIENLGLVDVNITGSIYVGGIVGVNSYSTVSNSYSTGMVIGSSWVGGLFGHNHASSVSNSYSTASVTGPGWYAGGIAGMSSASSSISNSYSTASVNGLDYVGGLVGLNRDSTIINSYSTASVNGTGWYAGGLAGMNSFSSSISNSHSTANVDGFEYVGGLVGLNRDSTIIYCYSTESVSGTNIVAGLVGINEWNSLISNCYSKASITATGHDIGGLVGQNNSSTISNCYSAGSVTTAGDYVGGLVGYNFSSTVSNSFWDIETSGIAASVGGTGKTTNEMLNVATYTSLSSNGLNTPWDFLGNPFDDTGNEDYWDIEPALNDGYPFFANPPTSIVENVVPEFSGKLFNYPNPFNPTTTIEFSLPSDSEVTISIYNLKGQKLKTIINQSLPKGKHQTLWNGIDNRDKPVSSGVYFYKLDIDGKTKGMKKMLLLK